LPDFAHTPNPVSASFIGEGRVGGRFKKAYGLALPRLQARASLWPVSAFRATPGVFRPWTWLAEVGELHENPPPGVRMFIVTLQELTHTPDPKLCNHRSGVCHGFWRPSKKGFMSCPRLFPANHDQALESRRCGPLPQGVVWTPSILKYGPSDRARQARRPRFRNRLCGTRTRKWARRANRSHVATVFWPPRRKPVLIQMP